MAGRGRNLTYLRSTNQGELLKAVLTKGKTSRQELASVLNLTAMSISNITSELIRDGLLCETSGESSVAPGRRASVLTLAAGQIYALGISVSRHQVSCSVVDLNGSVEKTLSAPLTSVAGKEEVEKLILSLSAPLLAEYTGKRVLGIGVSASGMVNSHDGVIVSATEFFGIADWHIGEALSERFSLPVYVLEDMKSSALAESYYGTAIGYGDYLYLGITYGVGVGVIHHGRLFDGYRGFSGEIGHTTLYGDGEKCACGNYGCAEIYLKVPAVLERAGLSRWEEFADKCEATPEDPVVLRFLRDLAALTVNLVNLYDPQMVVIGHEGAQLPACCYRALSEAVNERCMVRGLRKVAVKPSVLSEQIPTLSAAAVVFDRLFCGEFKL